MLVNWRVFLVGLLSVTAALGLDIALSTHGYTWLSGSKGGIPIFIAIFVTFQYTAMQARRPTESPNSPKLERSDSK